MFDVFSTLRVDVWSGDNGWENAPDFVRFEFSVSESSVLVKAIDTRDNNIVIGDFPRPEFEKMIDAYKNATKNGGNG